jgi:hypothetical protein
MSITRPTGHRSSSSGSSASPATGRRPGIPNAATLEVKQLASRLLVEDEGQGWPSASPALEET